MKKVFLILPILLISVNVYAVDITVTLTQEQYDAMSVLTSTPEEWVQNSVTAKSNKMIDVLVKKYSDKQPGKISKGEKEAIIRTIDLDKERRERRGK